MALFNIVFVNQSVLPTDPLSRRLEGYSKSANDYVATELLRELQRGSIGGHPNNNDKVQRSISC